MPKSSLGCEQCMSNASNSNPQAVHSVNHDQPSNWWHCSDCGAHMDRYRGVGDQYCVCGTEYNLGGQRLRSNWRENSSSHDEDITDLDGYELELTAAESAR